MLDQKFLNDGFKNWKQPNNHQIVKIIETSQGSIIIEFTWDVFLCGNLWLYQRYIEGDDKKNIELSYDIIKNAKGKVLEVSFATKALSIHPAQLNIRNRSKIILKVKDIFYDYICYPRKEFKPDIGDIVVGYPYGLATSARMFDTLSPGGSEKRGKLYKAGGMSDIQKDGYQYGIYNEELRIKPYV